MNFRVLVAVMAWCIVLLPGLSPAEPLTLTLQDAVRLTLERNPEIKVERHGVRAREAELAFEEAKFSPALDLALTGRQTVRPSAARLELDADVADVDHKAQEAAAGITKQLYTGGTYEVKALTSRTTSNSIFALPEAYSSDLELTWVQPLLKGRGREVTRTDLTMASNNVAISRDALEQKATDLVVQVGQAYWDLVYQVKNLDVQEQLHRSGLTLMEVNRAKVEEGLLPATEILVAEAAAAAREEQVLIAKKKVKDAEDQLRRLLHASEAGLLDDRPVIPVDEPEVRERVLSLHGLVKHALARRPEAKQARTELNNQEVALRRARQHLLPNLDFRGGAGVNGLGDSLSTDIDRLGSGQFFNWEAGLAFSVPLGNGPARSMVRKHQAEVARARAALVVLEQQVVLEVKEAIRRVETDRQRVAVTRKALELAGKKLEIEMERLQVGLSTSHEVLRAQADLAEAKGRELKALVDFQAALIHLDAMTGELLERFGVEIAVS